MTRRSVKTAEDHLRSADPVLGAIMDEVAREGSAPMMPPDPTVRDDPNMPTDSYGLLVRAIVSQNISTVASRAIYLRLAERFGGRPPTPQEILDDDPDKMRVAAGLSRAKTTSLRSLADCIVSGQLDVEQLQDLPDKDVVAQLDVVKGIGTWTADMFLMFHLYRPDVLAVGDLALRRAVQRAYGLGAPPGPAELQRIADPWRPHRTLACMYFWESAHATPQV
jgi:DNA-3-methyladenine glycosylase II